MSDQSGCDHIGGPELIEMAERYLRERSIPESEWNGRRFSWGEQVDSPWWKSVYIEVEHRGGSWVVTRLDRMKEPLDDARRGFLDLALK